MRTLMAVVFMLVSIGAGAAELPSAAYYRGELALPDGNRLPIELEFFRDASGVASANMASPAQGNRYISVTSVKLEGTMLAVTTVAPNARISGELDADGRWNASFVQGEFQAELSMMPSQGMTELARAQSIDALKLWPGQEINIAADGAALAGTFVSPAQAKAAVLLLAGSGRAQRDGYHAGHRPLAVLAAELAEAKVASLRFDKRGVNRSSGQLDVTDLHTIVVDAGAALAKLRQLQPDVPVVLIGHSEGALVAAMLAAADPDVSGVVSLMGPSMPTLDLFTLQDGTEAMAEGASAEQAAVLSGFTRRVYEVAAKHSDPEQRMAALGAVMQAASDQERELFERYNGGSGTLGVTMLSAPHYDDLLSVQPMDAWNAVQAPALLLFGEHDVQVPAAPNVELVDGMPGLEVRVVKGINHMLQSTDDGAPSRYAQIEVSVAKPLLAEVVDWVRSL